jgi:hypothetical protein
VVRYNNFVSASTTNFWVESWNSRGSTLKVYRNAFTGGPYNAVQIKPGGYNGAEIDASENFWGGTKNQVEIESYISDSSDSIRFASKVKSDRPLDNADANVPRDENLAFAYQLKKQTGETQRQIEQLDKAAQAMQAAQAAEAAQKAVAEKAAADAAAVQAKARKVASSDEVELDGEAEDPVGDLSASYNSASQRYSISISTNLASESFVIRATRKGAKSLQYKVTTNDEGEFKFSTKNKLKGYTLTLLFNGERLDSFKVK